MIIDEITISYARKYGLPEYSNIDIFMSTKAKLESGDQENINKISIELSKNCKEIVEKEGEKALKEYYDKKTMAREKINAIIGK